MKTHSETNQQTTSNDTGMSPLSRAPNGASPKLTPFRTLGSDTLTPFKTLQRSMDTLASFKTLVKRVTKLNPKYMVPVNEASLVRWQSWLLNPKNSMQKQRSTTKRIEIQPHLHRAIQHPSKVQGIFKHYSPTALTASVIC